MTLDDVPLIREKTVTEILAYRGNGKSMLVASLIKILTDGGEFAGFRSDGGKRVLLVDGELPEELLQSRLRQMLGKTERNATLLRLRASPLARYSDWRARAVGVPALDSR